VSASPSPPPVQGGSGLPATARRLAGGPLWQFALVPIVGLGLAAFGWRYLDRHSGPAIVIQDPRADATIVVQVGGAVATPGVYDFPYGARLDDALDRAGGPLPEADLATLNLARRLEDGEQIVVPVLQPTATPASPGQPTAIPPTAVPTPPSIDDTVEAPSTATLINLNTATVEELMELPEIGEVRAEAIVAYREANGPFASVDELVNVDGISERIVEIIRPYVTV
jgi:competence protein ComEA